MKPLLNNRYLTHPVLLVGIRFLVGGIFVVFGLSKAIEPQQAFYVTIRAYSMLPGGLVPVFATCVLIAEIVLGLCVIVGIYVRVSKIGLLILLAMFMIAITQALLRGIYLEDCGCSGSFVHIGDTPAQVLTRDAVLFVLLLWATIADKKNRYTLDRLLHAA